MSTGNALLVTHSADRPTGLVASALEVLGARSVRFDTDRFPTEVRLQIEHGRKGDRLWLLDGDSTTDLGDLSAIWYRRVLYAGRLPADMDPELRSAARLESETTVVGLLASLDIFQMDPLWRVRRAQAKSLQLKVAREVGLDIPRTLTTNDPEAVRSFAAAVRGRMIGKMLSSFRIGSGDDEKVVYTNRIDPRQLEGLDGLSLSPMTFQEEIPKALELRATIVGGRVLCASIDSQVSERASVDWRRDGAAMAADWQAYSLPGEVETRLLALTDRLGLQYGAADLILTPELQYVFLELNPVGEFEWLQHHCGLPIAAAIADVLVGRHRRPWGRSPSPSDR